MEGDYGSVEFPYVYRSSKITRRNNSLVTVECPQLVNAKVRLRDVIRFNLKKRAPVSSVVSFRSSRYIDMNEEGSFHRHRKTEKVSPKELNKSLAFVDLSIEGKIRSLKEKIVEKNRLIQKLRDDNYLLQSSIIKIKKTLTQPTNHRNSGEKSEKEREKRLQRIKSKFNYLKNHDKDSRTVAGHSFTKLEKQARRKSKSLEKCKTQTKWNCLKKLIEATQKAATFTDLFTKFFK